MWCSKRFEYGLPGSLSHTPKTRWHQYKRGQMTRREKLAESLTYCAIHLPELRGPRCLPHNLTSLHPPLHSSPLQAPNLSTACHSFSLRNPDISFSHFWTLFLIIGFLLTSGAQEGATKDGFVLCQSWEHICCESKGSLSHSSGARRLFPLLWCH